MTKVESFGKRAEDDTQDFIAIDHDGAS